MERLLIYAAASAGIAAGFILCYHKPAPFGSRFYDKKKTR